MENVPKKRGRPRKGEGKGLELTPKQRIFVAEYQKDWNGSRAALAAGYSKISAPDIAHDLINKSQIKEALTRAMNERLRKIGVHSERILTELARIGFSDLRKLYRPDGSMKNPEEWDDETAAAVSGLETFEEFSGSGDERMQVGFTKKLKLIDKTKALEMLGRYDGLFKEGGPQVQVGVVILEAPAIQKPDNAGMGDD